MSDSKRVLVMGGTEEGRSLAERTCQKFKVFYSLAGRTTTPTLPENVQVRSGGFGGAKALSHWLSKKNISAVVDATHPFSKQIKENVDRACHQQQIHRLTLTRPKWEQLPDDQWHNVFDIQMAATTIKSHGKRAFISVGRQELQQFSQLNGIELVIRSIEAPIEKNFLLQNNSLLLLTINDLIQSCSTPNKKMFLNLYLIDE